MNKKTKFLSLLTVFAMTSSVFTFSVGAKNEEDRKIRIIIENNTLSADDGADWVGTLADEWVPIDSETTAVSAFLSVLEAHGYTQTGADFDYITEINGLSAEDGGAMGGWMVSLDNWITDESISAYTVASGKLENGDELRFSYSVSWGADLGYDWSGSDTSLSEVLIENGSLDQELNGADKTYQIVLDQNADSIKVTPVVKNTAYRAKVYKKSYTPTEAGTDYKPGQYIDVADGDIIYVGVANSSWMQSNYNNAEESIYTFTVSYPKEKSVLKTIEIIDQIGTVTKDSDYIIRTARNSYDSLTDEQKAQVTNYDVLLSAEEAYAEILRVEISNERVAEAIKNINEIGEVTFYSGPAISYSRKFYERLTDEEKTKVTNYDILVKAEEAFSLINDRKGYVEPEKFKESFYDVFGTDFVYGNEWNIINAARFEIMTDDIKNGYIKSVKQALDENGGNKLSSTRSTVNSGVVTALSSLGFDASDFYGYDLVSPLCDVEYVKNQGVNGSIYALIALDTNNYNAPEGTREALIEDILSAQQEDGGWTIDTWSDKKDGSDADLTAMALQALAPYYNNDNDTNKKVVNSVDKALAFLSEMFMESFDSEGYGLFTSYGSYDCESSAQVIIALCALGIDVRTDERFSKDGYNAYNSLLQYLYREDMQFAHLESTGSNTFATIQGYTAASAFYRFVNNKTSYYDMSDVMSSKTDDQSSEQETSKTISPDFDNVRTGDSTSSAFALVLLIISLTAITAAGSKKKKNN